MNKKFFIFLLPIFLLGASEGSRECQVGGCSLNWVRTISTNEYQNSSDLSRVTITDLAFPIDANQRVIVKCDLITQSASAAIGVQLSVTGPASPVSVYYNRATTNAGATAGAWLTLKDYHATDDSAPAACFSVDTCISPVQVVIRNGVNAGTVNFAFQPETDGNLVKILAGSMCERAVF